MYLLHTRVSIHLFEFLLLPIIVKHLHGFMKKGDVNRLSLQSTGVAGLLCFEDSTYSLTTPLVLALALVLSLWELCALPLSGWRTSTFG